MSEVICYHWKSPKGGYWRLVDWATHYKTGDDFAVLTNVEGDTIIYPWKEFLAKFEYENDVEMHPKV